MPAFGQVHMLCAAWGTMLCGVCPQASWTWHPVHRLLLVSDASQKAYTWHCASHQHQSAPSHKNSNVAWPQVQERVKWKHYHHALFVANNTYNFYIISILFNTNVPALVEQVPRLALEKLKFPFVSPSYMKVYSHFKCLVDKSRPVQLP